MDNIQRVVGAIKQCSGIVLPSDFPDFSSLYQRITFKDAGGIERHLDLRELETLLSPVLFVLQKRPGVMVPIQRPYAEQLFGTSAQMSFIPGKEAILFSERVYLSSPRNLHILAEGSILLFYESGTNGGRSAAIAVARALGSSLIEKEKLPPSILRRGVIDSQELNDLSVTKKITVTRFDNVMLFTRPVPLNRLRQLDCVDGANLVTARRISDEQTTAIIREAYKT